jgi:hypothetical protein
LFVFVCAECDARLTDPLSQVALPARAHQKYGNGIQLPVLMESGTFAVDPESWGPPWRTWEEIDPDEAAARGIHAPVYSLSDGAPGAIVIAPGDARGTVLIPERGGGDWNGATADPAVVEDAWRQWRAERELTDRFLARFADLPTLPGGEVQLRDLLVMQIAEYARHSGHADLLRERIDGRVGQ